MKKNIPDSRLSYEENDLSSKRITLSSLDNNDNKESRLSMSSNCRELNTYELSCKKGSIVQPLFFRIRPYTSTIPPSAYYAIPEQSAIKNDHIKNKSGPIQFIGLDVAEFDESDPSKVYTHLYSTNNMELHHRRQSIVVMEGTETSINDAILSRIDEEEDDSFCIYQRGRVSIGGGKSELRGIDGIPTSGLRSYLRKQKELEEVNRLYYRMCEEIMQQKKENERKMIEEIDSKDDEDSLFGTQCNISDYDNIDELVSKNNLHNRRLSSTSISIIEDESSFQPNHLSSPRLSSIAKALNNVSDVSNDPQQMNVSNEVRHSIVKQIVNRMSSSLQIWKNRRELIDNLTQASLVSLKLCEYDEEIGYNWNHIDQIQLILNSINRTVDLLQIEYDLENLHNINEMRDMLQNVADSLVVYTSISGWKLSRYDKSELSLEFSIRNSVIYLMISFPNGQLVQIRPSYDRVYDSEVDKQINRKRILKECNEECRICNLVNIIGSLTFDFSRIKKSIERK